MDTISINNSKEKWEKKRIGNICPLQRGYDLPSYAVETGKYPVVYSNGILKYHSEYKVKGPGVVTGRSGTIGKVTYIDNDFWPHNTTLWVTDFFENLPQFIYYLLQGLKLKKYLAGTGVPTLNRNIIHSLEIPLPPLPEQKKIAEILSTWDEAIQLTDRLIKEKERYKKGLSQQLLTGKMRFKGFENETGYKNTKIGNIPKDWKIYYLNDVVEFLDHKREPIKDIDRKRIKGHFPYYGASGIIDYINDYIFDEDLILLAEDGANIVSRSTPVAFKATSKYWVNNHAHVLKPYNNVNIDYLTEYLESISYIKYNSGTTQPKLNRGICDKIEVLLPPLPEQKKIAELLTSCDKELDLLRKQKQAYEKQKQGLMQQLLTGKVRVKLD